MAVWILKAVIQKSVSFLPFKHRINFLFQKYVTKGVLLSDSLFEDKLTHCGRHIQAYKKYSAGGADNFTAFELGTGWYPIVPVGLYLAGAGKIYTTDIESLLTEERVHLTLERYIRESEKGFSFKIDEGRLSKIKELTLRNNLSVAELLEQMNIISIIGDARSTGLPEKSIDLVNSNNTFEHIPAEILVDLLKEFKRIAKPGGVMSHAIDMSDHFAHSDHSITPYNFLKFSDSAWNLIDNSIQPQNRMRIYEHEELYKLAGLPVTERVVTGPGNDSIKSISVDKRFSAHKPEENAILHAALISQMSR